MFEYITDHLMGSQVSVALTGLPVIITGEVVNSGAREVIGLKQNGRTIYISADLIALVF